MSTYPNSIGLIEAPGAAIKTLGNSTRQATANFAQALRGLFQAVQNRSGGLILRGGEMTSGTQVPAGEFILLDDVGGTFYRVTTASRDITFEASSGTCALYAVIDLRDDPLYEPGVDADSAGWGVDGVSFVARLAAAAAPAYALKLGEGPVTASSFDSFTETALVRATWRAIGDGEDRDVYLYVDNGDADQPFLRYLASGSKWQLSNNGVDVVDLGGGGGGALDDLSDVTLTTPARGHLLHRGATDWNNLSPGAAGTYLKSGGAGADLSWDSPAGGGDMLKSVYDTDDDGRVEGADQVTDGTNTATAAQVRGHLDSTANPHSVTYSQTGAAAASHTHAAGDITSGELAAARLPAMVGDSGSGGTKGAVPAPAAGDATKFLKGDGTWASPAGGGDMLKSVYDQDGDGIVDAAESLDDGTDSATAAEVRAHLDSTANPHGVTYSQTGAAAASHTHAAGDVTSGQLALARGGAGADLSGTGPGFLKQASPGAAVTVAALSAGDLPSHSHAAGDITSGELAAARLPEMVGDSGSGGTKGAVPAPAAGDATKFLKGDATWAAALAHPASTAVGDLLYYTAAETLARLGVGTAHQKLRVNAAATAPEWSDDLLGPVTWVVRNPAVGGVPGPTFFEAVEVLDVSAYCVGGTDVDFNLENRTTIGSAGSNVGATEFVANLAGDASLPTLQNTAVAAGSELWLDISAVDGTVSYLRVAVKLRRT